MSEGTVVACFIGVLIVLAGAWLIYTAAHPHD